MNETNPAAQAGLPVPAQPMTGGLNPCVNLPQTWTSLDRSQPSGRKLFLAAVQGNAANLGDSLGSALHVTDIVCHTCEVTVEKTGELIDCVRTVLVTPDGDLFAAVSKGVFDSIGYLIAIYGPPPWEPALELIPRQKNTKKGRRVYYLEDCTCQESSAPESSPRKKK